MVLVLECESRRGEILNLYLQKKVEKKEVSPGFGART